MDPEKRFELHLVQSQYYKIFIRVLLACLLFIIYFFTVSYFDPNETISQILIFPVLIAAVIFCIWSIKQLTRNRREAREIKRTNRKSKEYLPSQQNNSGLSGGILVPNANR